MNPGFRKNQLHRILQIFVLLLVAHSSTAFALEEINSTYFGSKAIEGYDAVAYFTEGRAIEGSKEFEFSWKGANWRFASAENLTAFRANPESFAPQFGAIVPGLYRRMIPQKSTPHSLLCTKENYILITAKKSVSAGALQRTNSSSPPIGSGRNC